MDFKNKKIGVLMGGISREREISLRSGQAVVNALRARGYDVTEIDTAQDVWGTLRKKIDVAFLALHGRYGEDGTIQGLLEILKIPYTGSGVLASAIAMDKDLTKKLVVPAGVLTPEWVTVKNNIQKSPLPLPVIVKPSREGSTIGMTIVKEGKDFKAALDLALSHDDQVLVEKFVTGTEVTVGILDGKALPVLEIVPKSGTYDFASKYTQGMTEYIVPARIPKTVSVALMQLTEKIFSLLQLSGCARMDFIIHDDIPYFLEVNTIPGMTETSLVPKAAQAAGLTFEDVCEKILKTASLKV